MSQQTLDDDELFGEAATEMRDDVEESLAAARAELPDAEEVWDVDGDNALGVLNGLRTALDVADAESHLRDARKWYTMGERADAFDDAADLEADIAAVANLIEEVTTAREQVGELTSTLPQLRSELEDTEDEATDATSEDADAEAEANA
jgi:chromosome segregation ATPase